MIVRRHPDFKKAFKKRVALNPKLIKRARERINLFLENPQNPVLKDHQLTGKKKDLRAFSVTGGIRIVYFPISDNEALFLDIGTHNQVY